MVLKISRLKQLSIGVIVFGILYLIALSFAIMGYFNVFYTSYDERYDTINDLIVINGISGMLSSFPSFQIFIIFTPLTILFFGFWLFFVIKCYKQAKIIDEKIGLELKKIAKINFFSLLFGSVMTLGICNALLKNRKNDDYILSEGEN